MQELSNKTVQRRGQWIAGHLLCWSLLLGPILGCWESTQYTRREFYQLGKKSAPQLKIVRPGEEERWSSCFDYGRGCEEILNLSYQGVSFICVRYQDAGQAIQFGRSIDAYVAKNWLLDDVSGEPILERFVQRAWKAQKARAHRPQ